MVSSISKMIHSRSMGHQATIGKASINRTIPIRSSHMRTSRGGTQMDKQDSMTIEEKRVITQLKPLQEVMCKDTTAPTQANLCKD